MLLVVAREEVVAGNAQIVAVRVTPYSSRCHQKLFAIVSLLLSLVQSLRERGKERACARVCVCAVSAAIVVAVVVVVVAVL